MRFSATTLLSLTALTRAAIIPQEVDSDSGLAVRAASGYRSVAYFVNWAIYGRKFQPQQIPSDKLTHVLYAFADVHQDTGEVFLSDTYADLEIHYPGDSWDEPGTNVYGCVKQLFLLKKANRNMKTLLSIGGWTYSAHFAALKTPEGRTKFATSAVHSVQDLGFDGIDIDWEYPANDQDAANFVSLLHEVRKLLDSYSTANANNYHFLITVASLAGPENYKKLHIGEMDKYLDFWNLMAYDYAGSWGNVSGHDANLYAAANNMPSTPFNTDQAIKYYTNHGATASKIAMGNAFVRSGFDSTEGPGKPYSGVGPGTWEAGVYDYKALPQDGATIKTNKAIGASWTYDTNSHRMISYDTPEIASMKADYIKSKGLGGGMWWETSSDKTGAESLISTVVKSFGTLEQSKNCLSYPKSKYDNLKGGFKNSIQ